MTVDEAIAVLGAERFAEIRDRATAEADLNADQLDLIGRLFGSHRSTDTSERAA